MKFTLLLFLFVPPIFAQQLNISHGLKGELILKAKSCEILQIQREAVCKWGKDVDPTLVAMETASCKAVPVKLFQTVISSCVPKSVKATLEQRLQNSGPNCWGTAMSLHKLFPKPRYMWSEEMNYWLNETPLCRKLNVGEPKQPGDILSMYGAESSAVVDPPSYVDAGTKFWDALYPGRRKSSTQSGYTGYHIFLHSETYISDQLAYGKDSPNKDDRFGFHAMEEVYGRPRDSKKECQEMQAKTPYLREYQNPPRDIRYEDDCAWFSLAHRCQNVAEYFEVNVKSEEDRALWKNIQALQAIQNELFELVTSQTKVFPKKVVDQYVSLAKINMKLAEQELAKKPKDKLREMLQTHLMFSAAGIIKSLELANVIPKNQ